MLEPSQIPYLHELLLSEDWITADHLLRSSSSSSTTTSAVALSNGSSESALSPPPSPGRSQSSRAVLGGVVARTKSLLPSVLGSAVDLGVEIAKSLTPGFVLEGAGHAVVKAGQLGLIGNLLLDEKMPADKSSTNGASSASDMSASAMSSSSASNFGDGTSVNPLRDPPLCWVARKNQPKLVDLLVAERAGLEVRHEGGATPLYLACQEGHAEVVRRLLKHGARVDSADKDGWLPLHAAGHNGHLACVELLLESHKARRIGIDMASSNSGMEPRGATALHLACREAHTEVVKALLRADAHPKARTRANATPLHFAAAFSPTEIVQLLLNKVSSSGSTAQAQQAALSSYTNSIDVQGSTALHWAAKHRPKQARQTCELLLSVGADPTIVNQANRTPLRQSISTPGAGDLVALFLDIDRLPILRNESPIQASSEKEAVEQLLLKSAKGNDRSASAAALSRLHLDVVFALLGHARNLEARCAEAETKYARLVSGFAEDGNNLEVNGEPQKTGKAGIETSKTVVGPLLDDPWRRPSESSSTKSEATTSTTDLGVLGNGSGIGIVNGHSSSALPEPVRTVVAAELDSTFAPLPDTATSKLEVNGIRFPAKMVETIGKPVMKPVFDEPEFQGNWS